MWIIETISDTLASQHGPKNSTLQTDIQQSFTTISLFEVEKTRIYAPVNIAIENRHFSWETPYTLPFSIAILTTISFLGISVS